MPIDYSKWKEIEVSDDEDDVHPNIDTPSLFRLRHQSRLERMAEQKDKREALEKQKKALTADIEEMKDVELTDELKAELEKKKAELDQQNAEFYKKEAQLEADLAKQPWNVDTIGTEKFSKSRINKVKEAKPAPPKLSDEEDTKLMTEYFEANETLLRSFGQLTDRRASEALLLSHPHLASEYAANFLTIEALNLAIEEKDEPMKVLARQTVVVQYLLEFSKTLNAIATNTGVIQTFFKKFNAADAAYLKLYDDEVAAFEERLRQRARTKRDEAMLKYAAEEKAKRVKASPGGLDPQEVLESLPEEIKTAFESQSVDALQAVASKMDQEVFLHHLNRCIDSGLWLPNKEDVESDEMKTTEEVS